MNKLLWGIIIGDIVVFIAAIIAFCLGAALRNFGSMWGGFILFIIAVSILIIFFFIKTWLGVRNEKRNKISRD